MEFKRTLILSKSEKQEIRILWNNEYPKNLNYPSLTDFEDYLKKITEQSHIIMIDENQNILGWYVDFMRDDEKWFALIVDSKVQGKGLGNKILTLAKEKATELNGWVIDHDNYKKVNGEVYKSPLKFYIKNGFEVFPLTRLELERICALKIKWEK